MREADFLAENVLEFTVTVQVPPGVEVPDGKKSLSYAVKLTDKMSTLKAKIQADLGIAPGKQTLRAANNPLNNVNSFAFYNITSSTVIALTMKKR